MTIKINQNQTNRAETEPSEIIKSEPTQIKTAKDFLTELKNIQTEQKFTLEEELKEELTPENENKEFLTSLLTELPLKKTDWGFWQDLVQFHKYTKQIYCPLPVWEEPLVDFNQEKLQVTIRFPDPSESADTQKLIVEYNPALRSIAAEIITSAEAARILQAQLNTLVENLHKHNIKVNNLVIYNDENQPKTNKQKKDRKKRHRKNS